jgi:predicted nucleic acid-binding protein
MSSHLILDTGPWVALHCRDATHHEWAKAQFAQHAGPFLTCEAVVAETCFLLARSGFDPSRALALVERGVVRVAMSLAEQVAAVRALFERYDNVPASLADACLVRLSELHEPCRVLTLDSDFSVYRRHGRKVIPVLSPRPG